jgi:hypothetical protein
MHSTCPYGGWILMMSAPKNINNRLWELANAVCEGTIINPEVKELESLLKDDPVAFEFYINFLKIHSDILWLISSKPHSTMDIVPQTSQSADKRSPTLSFLGDVGYYFNQYSPLSFILLFAFLGMTLLAATFWLAVPNSGNVTAESSIVAQITVTKDCQWSNTITPSPELQAGQQLRLEKGLVQITYSNKAVVLLEGPASYTLESINSGFLSNGKLVAEANAEQARNFTILTPNSRFVDLGTEFGVMIDNKGRTAVAVFAGKVNAEVKLADGDWTAPVSFRKGEAAVCVESKFVPLVARRNDFPSLKPLPPPSSFERWLEARKELQQRQDLLAYYDFQPDPRNPDILLNLAPTGLALNGDIKKATWVNGRFSGKKGLEFMSADSGVHVNLPDEYKQLTVIAWVSSNQLVNKYQGILMSDSWGEPEKLHFQIQDSRQIVMHVFSQWVGPDMYCSTNTVPADSLSRWCMIAGVIDVSNNSINTYLNGEFFEKLATEDRISAVRIGSAMIGGWNKEDSADPNYPRNFSGRIDELMIFQRALSAEEIKQIHLKTKP